MSDLRDIARDQLPRLYSIARRLVGDEAEDAVQECLLKAYKSYDQLRDADAGPAWLVSILVNCCRDRGRARARHPAEVDLDSLDEFSLYRKIADEDPFPYSDSLHLDFLHQFGADDVRAVLASLPGHYRIPLVLTYMDGWATKEVADAGPAAGHGARAVAPRPETVREASVGVRRDARAA